MDVDDIKLSSESELAVSSLLAYKFDDQEFHDAFIDTFSFGHHPPESAQHQQEPDQPPQQPNSGSFLTPPYTFSLPQQELYPNLQQPQLHPDMVTFVLSSHQQTSLQPQDHQLYSNHQQTPSLTATTTTTIDPLPANNYDQREKVINKPQDPKQKIINDDEGLFLSTDEMSQFSKIIARSPQLLSQFITFCQSSPSLLQSSQVLLKNNNNNNNNTLGPSSPTPPPATASRFLALKNKDNNNNNNAQSQSLSSQSPPPTSTRLLTSRVLKENSCNDDDNNNVQSPSHILPDSRVVPLKDNVIQDQSQISRKKKVMDGNQTTITNSYIVDNCNKRKIIVAEGMLEEKETKKKRIDEEGGEKKNDDDDEKEEENGDDEKRPNKIMKSEKGSSYCYIPSTSRISPINNYDFSKETVTKSIEKENVDNEKNYSDDDNRCNIDNSSSSSSSSSSCSSSCSGSSCSSDEHEEDDKYNSEDEKEILSSSNTPQQQQQTPTRISTLVIRKNRLENTWERKTNNENEYPKRKEEGEEFFIIAPSNSPLPQIPPPSKPVRYGIGDNKKKIKIESPQPTQPQPLLPHSSTSHNQYCYGDGKKGEKRKRKEEKVVPSHKSSFKMPINDPSKTQQQNNNDDKSINNKEKEKKGERRRDIHNNNNGIYKEEGGRSSSVLIIRDDDDEEEEEEENGKKKGKNHYSSPFSESNKNQLWNRSNITTLNNNVKICKKLKKTDRKNNNTLVIQDMNTYKRAQSLSKQESFHPEPKHADGKSIFLFYDKIEHSWSDNVEARVVLNKAAFTERNNIDYELSNLFNKNSCKTVIVLVDTTDMKLFGSFLFNFLMSSTEYIFLISNIKLRYTKYLSKYNECQMDMTWSQFYDRKSTLDQRRWDLKQFLRSTFNDVNFSQIVYKEGFRNVQIILPSLYDIIENMVSFQSEENCATVDEAKEYFEYFEQARDGIWQVRCMENDIVKIKTENLMRPMNYYTQDVLIDKNCISFVYDVSKNRSAKENKISIQLHEDCINNQIILYHIISSYCRKFFFCEGKQKNDNDKSVNFIDERNADMTIGIAKEMIDNEEMIENQDLYVTIVCLFFKIFEKNIDRTDNKYRIWLKM